MDNRMKLLDASVKKYMIKKGLKSCERAAGSVFLIEQSRRMLDRALIDDIEKYKVDAKITLMYKSPN